jgi:hypothetical protein
MVYSGVGASPAGDKPAYLIAVGLFFYNFAQFFERY